MKTNTNIKQGETTNVKVEEIIDFRPLDTESREDDNVWNAMELYGESDEHESDYEPPAKISKENMRRALKIIHNGKVGQKLMEVL